MYKHYPLWWSCFYGLVCEKQLQIATTLGSVQFTKAICPKFGSKFTLCSAVEKMEAFVRLHFVTHEQARTWDSMTKSSKETQTEHNTSKKLMHRLNSRSKLFHIKNRSIYEEIKKTDGKPRRRNLTNITMSCEYRCLEDFCTLISFLN